MIPLLAVKLFFGRALAFLKAIPWQVWAAVAAAVALFAFGRIELGAGRAAQRATDAKTIAALQADVATARDNADKLVTALNQANKSITDAADAAKVITANGAKASHSAGDMREADLRGIIARLKAERAVRGLKPAVPCPASDTQREAADALL